MNNIQELVIDKVKALSINQQKSVLNFIDRILLPNLVKSDQEMEKLLTEGINSLERDKRIVATDDSWEQKHDRLIDSSQGLIDEVFDPSPARIAGSLHRALHEVKTGQTKPISQLWDSLDGI